MDSLQIGEFRRNVADTINRVAYRGDRIRLSRNGKDMAALVSVEDLELIERLEDEADIRAARKALKEEGGKPWEQVKRELGW